MMTLASSVLHPDSHHLRSCRTCLREHLNTAMRHQEVQNCSWKHMQWLVICRCSRVTSVHTQMCILTLHESHRICDKLIYTLDRYTHSAQVPGPWLGLPELLTCLFSNKPGAAFAKLHQGCLDAYDSNTWRLMDERVEAATHRLPLWSGYSTAGQYPLRPSAQSRRRGRLAWWAKSPSDAGLQSSSSPWQPAHALGYHMDACLTALLHCRHSMH